MAISWISEKDLDRHIKTLLESAHRAHANAADRRNKNVVDPFLSLLIASTFECTSVKELAYLQNIESASRGMSNALGTFHQNILASVKGWENHNAGYDLVCPEKMILAEVKNKWNTMNSSNRRQVENDLDTAIRQKAGNWNGYLALIIPKEPQRYKRLITSRVFDIDGASFYHIVTGDPNAIHDLFDHLCAVVAGSTILAEHCRTIRDAVLPPREVQT